MIEDLYNIGLEATRWLQAAYPQLAGFMQIFSELGRFEFYLAVIPIVYWCLDKRLGFLLAYVLGISNVANTFLKTTLRGPRPYWLPAGADLALGAEESYGIPSGHVQSAVVAYFFLAAWVRRGWAVALALVMVVGMMLSRIYLGVHFVHDALVGVIVGVLVLIGYAVWRRFRRERFRNRILGQRVLLMATVPLGVLALNAITLWLLGAPNSNANWALYTPTAERTGLEDMVQAAAILVGLGVGFMLETTYVRFQTGGPIWQRLLRYLLGIAVTLVIWRGLGLVFELINPSGTLWLALPLRFIRYVALGLWVAYYAPAVFVGLRLAASAAEPEIPFTVAGASLPSQKGKK